MSSHDLIMQEPKKVLAAIDEAVDALKKIQGTIETTSQIGNMDLAIGGLDQAFVALETLNSPVQDAIKVFETTKESIEHHVAAFARSNEDITY